MPLYYGHIGIQRDSMGINRTQETTLKSDKIEGFSRFERKMKKKEK